MSNNIEISRIPTSIQEILIKLKFIKNLKRGYKLNISSLTYSENSYFESVKRMFTGEGRKLTIEFIHNLVVQSLDTLENFSDTEFAETILNHLDEACLGLEILREGYSNDAEVSARISTILENIRLQLDKNRDFLNGRKKPKI